MSSVTTDAVHYTLKESPYSSHSVLLGALPRAGDRKRVLDIGCGNGYLASLLADRGYHVTGIEHPGHAKNFPANVSLIEADLERGLPALTETFDYVLCADVLEHLRRPEQLLSQIHATLKPSGKLLASLPNSGNLYFRLNVLAGRFPQHDKGLFDRTHLRFYTWKGWQELFERAGYAIRRSLPTGIPVGLAFAHHQDTVWVRSAESVCYGLAHLRKELFAYQFVVEADSLKSR